MALSDGIDGTLPSVPRGAHRLFLLTPGGELVNRLSSKEREEKRKKLKYAMSR